MSIAAADFQFVSTLVKRHAGIVLEPGKEYLVESRLRPIAGAEGFGSIGDMVNKVRATPNPRLQQKIICAMTTNETSFFRDLAPFEALRQNIVPELLTRRATTRSLNVWCAASSTGQEPYTIAMTLTEHFPQLATWKVNIVATDIAPEVLARAREGRYGQIEINRGLPARMLVKYFRKDNLEWVLDDRIRRMVEFRELNLTESFHNLPAADIVFMRNVLIYFDAATKKDIFARTRRLMRPDGYLFLGGAETTLGIDDAFERMPVERSGCYRLTAAARGTHV